MTLYNLNYNVSIEKVAVDGSKVVIQNKEVSIELEKQLFEEILNTTKFRETTKSKISKLFDIYGKEMIIGRSDIVKVTEDSLTAAGKLINKMKDVGLLEPVTGHGKGKYRFKI